MAKEVYYFSHDANARHDPKVTVMRSVYGAEGYGWYWILIEMMREADAYQLDCKSKYSFNAYALQMHCKCIEDAKHFILDCINEFELFESDGNYFWSNSLKKRMNKREEVREKKKAAALARWGKTLEPQGFEQDGTNNHDADAMHMHNGCNANAMQGKEILKERKKKGNIKEKDIQQQMTAFEFYQNNFGVIGSRINEQMQNWIDEFDDGNEIVILAMSIAIDNNQAKWSYCNAILQDWFNRGAKSLEQCRALQTEFKNRREKENAINGRYNARDIKKSRSNEGESWTTWNGETVDSTGVF